MQPLLYFSFPFSFCGYIECVASGYGMFRQLLLVLDRRLSVPRVLLLIKNHCNLSIFIVFFVVGVWGWGGGGGGVGGGASFKLCLNG